MVGATHSVSAPSFASACPSQPAGYYCHACDDECTNDSDCSAGTPPGSANVNVCRFDPTAGHWGCWYSPCGD